MAPGTLQRAFRELDPTGSGQFEPKIGEQSQACQSRAGYAARRLDDEIVDALRRRRSGGAAGVWTGGR
jgi:hypothetical protein